MAVELMRGYGGGSESLAARMEENAVKEAASAGIQSMEKLIRLLSQKQQNQYLNHESSSSSSQHESAMDLDCNKVAHVTVNIFRKVNSLLDRKRTGHARFRRAPVNPVQQKTLIGKPVSIPEIHHHQKTEHQKIENQTKTEEKLQKQSTTGFRLYCPNPNPSQRLPPLPNQHHVQKNGVIMERKDLGITTINFSNSPSISVSGATSFMSSLTGETDSVIQPSSMSSGFQITNMSSQVSSGGKPPLSTKRKCSSMDDSGLKCASSSGRCHCSKKRKSRVKRVVKIPAISMKIADIPPDDFSWRKYGQKPIKGSPHPRGYYKCSSVRGCPARKHVERSLDDPTMLIVTYENEHNHIHPINDGATVSPMVLESS